MVDPEAKGVGRPAPSDRYWQDLVRAESNSSLDEVGHPDMGRAFNVQTYKIRRDAAVGALKAAGVLLRDSRVFEAGFGVGHYLQLWQAAGCSAVSGVDISPTAAGNVHRRFPSYDLRAGDLAEIERWADWPSQIRRYDVVMAIDVLYHIVDDVRAVTALNNLASLLATGGVLIFTEKFPTDGVRLAEHHHVTRRPLKWYQEVLGPDLIVERTAPVFWCLDPALPIKGRRSIGDLAARLIWVVIRASTKYLPRGSKLQDVTGWTTGQVGVALDRFAVGRARSAGNMRIVTVRRRI